MQSVGNKLHLVQTFKEKKVCLCLVISLIIHKT